MKIGRIICAFGLVVLCAFGWGAQLLGKASDSNLYEEQSQQAVQFVEDGLYQKAIQAYEQMLNVKEDDTVRRAMIDCYAAAYAEGVIDRGDYVDALEDACNAQPDQAYYWECLLDSLYRGNSFSAAEKKLKQLARTNAHSEKLDELTIQIKYAYKTSRVVYQQVIGNAEGYTTVCSEDEWGVVTPDGKRIYDCVYRYISPYSADEIAAFYLDDSARLLDRDKVVYANLPLEYAQSRAYGDGLLPVFQDGTWKYLICEDGTYLPGTFEDVSCFQNGTAAVKSNGIWHLINTSGEDAAEVRFDDVKLFDSGAYVYDEIMIADVGGYGMYHVDGKKVNDFAASDMDLYLGSYVAYQDENGLWGYVDKKGQIVIEPAFQEAKSFSGGLAAVYDGTAWGFINGGGTYVIEPQFVDVGYFSKEGVCFVSTFEGEYYMITLRFPGGR